MIPEQGALQTASLYPLLLASCQDCSDPSVGKARDALVLPFPGKMGKVPCPLLTPGTPVEKSQIVCILVVSTRKATILLVEAIPGL